MSNQLYGLARGSFLDGDIDWTNDNIKVVLVHTASAGGYIVSINTHQFLSDVPGTSRVSMSNNLAGKTSTLGTADADDTTIGLVSASQTPVSSVHAFIVFQSASAETAARLIAYFDTATGMPLVPSNGDIVISWSSGANKIFTL